MHVCPVCMQKRAYSSSSSLKVESSQMTSTVLGAGYMVINYPVPDSKIRPAHGLLLKTE